MRGKKKQEPFSLFAFQDAIASVCGLVVLITLILALELTNQIVEEATAPPPSEIDFQKVSAEIATLKENLASLEKTTQNLNETALIASRSQFSLKNAETELRDAEKLLAETVAESERLQGLIADANERSRFEELEFDAAKNLAELNALDQEIARLAEENRRPVDGSIYYSTNASVRETPWLIDVAQKRIVARSLAPNADPNEQFNEFSGDNAQNDFLSWAAARDSDIEYFILLFRPSGASLHDDLRNALEKAGFKIGVDLVGETQTVEINR